MKKTVSIAALLAIASAGSPLCMAATQTPPKSFEEFRKGILSDFSDFRKTIIDHYYDFLNGEWHEYQSLNGESRYSKPKPRTLPVAPVSQSNPASAPPAGDKPVKRPAVDVPSSMSDPSRRQPEGIDAPAAPASAPASRAVDDFCFYEIPMQLPKIEFSIRNRLSAPSDYAAQWKELDKSGVASEVLPHVRKLVKNVGLNDFLTFRLLMSYVDSKFSYADPSSRMSAVHFFLANMGYDARIAMTGSGVPLLLLPCNQTIYARIYMTLPGGGKYYVFGPDGFDLSRMSGEKILTCTLPADAASGKHFDLKLGPLKIPVKPKGFEFAYGKLHLKGEVNENLMPILYRYPQIPIADYAQSELDPELRGKLVAQVRSQIGEMEGDRAVAELLGFMHNVFEYSTDEEFHGFEKPYFLEETLYYPKNDCEDRAIFYTYFLWHALGRESQLVSFPGHEAATVRLDSPIDGTSYSFSDGEYFISDPTYIGAETGMVMPVYRKEIPKVDFTYR